MTREPFQTKVRGKGKSHERNVQKALKNIFPDVPLKSCKWFEVFLEDGSSRVLQPDIFLILPDRKVLVIECKTTVVSDAFVQLGNYQILLESWLNIPSVGIVAAQNLSSDVRDAIISVDLLTLLGFDEKQSKLVWRVPKKSRI